MNNPDQDITVPTAPNKWGGFQDPGEPDFDKPDYGQETNGPVTADRAVGFGHIAIENEVQAEGDLDVPELTGWTETDRTKDDIPEGVVVTDEADRLFNERNAMISAALAANGPDTLSELPYDPTAGPDDGDWGNLLNSDPLSLGFEDQALQGPDSQAEYERTVGLR